LAALCIQPVLNLTDKPETPPGYRLDEALLFAAVADRSARCLDAAG
jgi:hypothetical protein